MRCSEQSLHILGRAKGRRGRRRRRQRGQAGFHGCSHRFSLPLRQCVHGARGTGVVSAKRNSAALTSSTGHNYNADEPSRCFRFDWPSFSSRVILPRYLTQCEGESNLSLSLALEKRKEERKKDTRGKSDEISVLSVFNPWRGLRTRWIYYADFCGWQKLCVGRKVTPVRNGTGEWEVARTVDRKIKLIRWRCGRGGRGRIELITSIDKLTYARPVLYNGSYVIQRGTNLRHGFKALRGHRECKKIGEVNTVNG